MIRTHLLFLFFCSFSLYTLPMDTPVAHLPNRKREREEHDNNHHHSKRARVDCKNISPEEWYREYDTADIRAILDFCGWSEEEIHAYIETLKRETSSFDYLTQTYLMLLAAPEKIHFPHRTDEHGNPLPNSLEKGLLLLKQALSEETFESSLIQLLKHKKTIIPFMDLVNVAKAHYLRQGTDVDEQWIQPLVEAHETVHKKDKVDGLSYEAHLLLELNPKECPKSRHEPLRELEKISRRQKYTFDIPVAAEKVSAHIAEASVLFYEQKKYSYDRDKTLRYASLHGYLGLIDFFIHNKKIDVNTSSPYNRETPLLYAAKGSSAAVKKLLQLGAHVNVSTDKGETPLSRALHFLDDSTVIEDLLNHESYVNTCDAEGETPLHTAIQRRWAYVVKLLLTKGAHVNVATFKHGVTPLMRAARLGEYKIVSQLIKHGAYVETLDQNQRSALFYVLDNNDQKRKRIEIAQLLLQKSANANRVDRDEISVLMHGCREAPSELIALLIHHGAAINTFGKHYTTPLMIAARYGTPDTLQQLVEGGADVNQRTPDQNHALMEAVKGGKISNVKKLVEL